MRYIKSLEKKKKECPLIIGRAGRGRARKKEDEKDVIPHTESSAHLHSRSFDERTQ